jgi:hypothetical protein
MDMIQRTTRIERTVDGRLTLFREIEEQFTENEMQQKRSHLIAQATEIKRQAVLMKQRYDEVMAQVAEVDVYLTQFPEGVPDIPE